MGKRRVLVAKTGIIVPESIAHRKFCHNGSLLLLAGPLEMDEARYARLYQQVAQQLRRQTRSMALPFSSLGPLFKGRDEFIEQLRASLRDAPQGHATAIVGKAVHGLGGVGKTRLAIEYAWQHVEQYTALLCVAADTPETLARNLAGRCGPAVLDLPEQHLPAEASARNQLGEGCKLSIGTSPPR